MLGTLAGVYCGANVLILTTIATFWEEAYRQETAILADVQRAVPPSAPGSTLLLDGECPYVGPAVVFDSDWDLAGSVRLMRQRPDRARQHRDRIGWRSASRRSSPG